MNSEKSRRHTNPQNKLADNLRNRTRAVFKTQNVKKSKKTFDLLGCQHCFFQKWILFQLFGDMTLENYGKNWCIDHCLAINSFNLFDENFFEKMRKCFNWQNLRPK